jgi:hypothetical protein
MRALNAHVTDTLREYRPDIIGWVVGPELKAQFEEEMALMSDATFFDLTDPWLHSPR